MLEVYAFDTNNIRVANARLPKDKTTNVMLCSIVTKEETNSRRFVLLHFVTETSGFQFSFYSLLVSLKI
jgi:hypothetical protein